MIWQMAHIPGSQVGPYLEEGWEPFAVVPGIPLTGALALPEAVVYLKRPDPALHGVSVRLNANDRITPGRGPS